MLNKWNIYNFFIIIMDEEGIHSFKLWGVIEMFIRVKKTIRDEKGFTMIELIIVVAIMGILAAILAPSFTTMSRKARINADIKGLQELQRHVQIYYANNGSYPDANMETNDLMGLDFAIGRPFADNLINNEYMNSRYFNASGVRLQTISASVIWSAGSQQFFLDTTACDPATQKVVQDLKNKSTFHADWLR